MKKEIKIIDLFNKKANDEELPKKIKYENRIYELDICEEDYECFMLDHHEYLLGDINMFSQLNDEVEIIEEEKEEFEDIEQIQLKDGRIISNYDGENHYITTNVKDKEVYIKRINQLIINQKKLIDVVNELKKGNKK